MAIESLGDLLRACGQNPTLAEIADLEKGVGGDCGFFFSFLSFLPCFPHLLRFTDDCLEKRSKMKSQEGGEGGKIGT